MAHISNHDASGKPHGSEMKCEINRGGDKREAQRIYRQKQKQNETGITVGHSM